MPPIYPWTLVHHPWIFTWMDLGPSMVVPNTPLESECPKYSKEAFVEAILEFIVGDDQVCAYFLISGKINLSPGYQCC